MEVVIIGAGPAGMVAALPAAELGAKTVLITRGEVGGMAAHDGSIPVRVLAQAARLLREAKQLGKYGISTSEPILDYPRLLRLDGAILEGIGNPCGKKLGVSESS